VACLFDMYSDGTGKHCSNCVRDILFLVCACACRVMVDDDTGLFGNKNDRVVVGVNAALFWNTNNGVVVLVMVRPTVKASTNSTLLPSPTTSTTSSMRSWTESSHVRDSTIEVIVLGLDILVGV